jgi:hypothetical protein
MYTAEENLISCWIRVFLLHGWNLRVFCTTVVSAELYEKCH